MKICSVCGDCYDDSAMNCAVEDHGLLTGSRRGSCSSVKGYKINSEIASDFPSKLYNAAHLSSGKNVLIKFLEFDSPEQFGELQAEIKKVSQINHPNLAKVFEFGKIDDAEIYIVSEEIPGQNLREYLEINAPLPEKDAIKIARQIAEGLEVLHENCALHRAVNPSNIYFANAENTDFSVKLQNYDFGGIEQKTIAGGANGVDAKSEIFRYFSPEQFTGQGIDFKSDLYSLAIVFYEMLLGRVPYKFINPRAISNYVFNERDVEKLHFDLRALIAYNLKQSLQHGLNLRPPTTNNLARQLRHLELTAAPLLIGLPKTAKNKQKQTLNAFQTDKPEMFVAEEKNPNSRDIKVKFSEEKDVIPAVYSVQEFSAAEDILDLGIFGNDLKELKVFEVSTKTKSKIVAAKSVEIEEPAIRISEEINKSGEQNPADEFIKFDTTDLAEFEAAFDSIHITNRDDDDEQSEMFLSEIPEYADPEFVEQQPKLEPPSARQPAKSFVPNAVPRSSSFKKSYVYIAGIIALFVFGGFAAVSLWQSRNNKTPALVSSQKVEKPEDTEKKEKAAAPESIKETAEITEEPAALPQYEGRQSEEIFKPDETSSKPRSNKFSPNQPAFITENRPAPIVKEKIGGATVENKTVNEPPFKKREKTQTIDIRDIQTTTVIVVGREKPIIKKADAANKPRPANNAPSGN